MLLHTNHYIISLEARSMFHKKVVAFAVAALAFAFLVSCSNGSGTTHPDFVGTWAGAAGSGSVETLTMDENTVTVSITSGGGTGSFTAHVTSYDESAKHILMTVTAINDPGDTYFKAAMPVGTVEYMTYSVTGTAMYFSATSSGYPASATSGPNAQGPLTKQ